jgi:hypothetical protein
LSSFSRASAVARLLSLIHCRLSTNTRVVAIQRHDFRVPALNLRLLFHALIPQANPTTFIAFFSIPSLPPL